jgi:hypothetical protein
MTDTYRTPADQAASAEQQGEQQGKVKSGAEAGPDAFPKGEAGRAPATPEGNPEVNVAGAGTRARKGLDRYKEGKE